MKDKNLFSNNFIEITIFLSMKDSINKYSLQPLKKFQGKLEVIFSDIDDTMTTDGKLTKESYSSLWSLYENNIQVIPVTGRPAGWCEMIARLWPVSGIIGENGAFYFRYDLKQKKMLRYYADTEANRKNNQKKLEKIKEKIFKSVPKSRLASDQFCRISDLAIDFCEDIKKLSPKEIAQIVHIFSTEGANAKVSSIHVNGWFGHFDKLSTAKKFAKNIFKYSELEIQKKCGFIGDSPNDEPMFKYFQNSFGVANVLDFRNEIKNLPHYIASEKSGKGFSEICKFIIKLKKTAIYRCL